MRLEVDRQALAQNLAAALAPINRTEGTVAMSQDELTIDVERLSPEQRRVLEEITGRHLAGVRQVTIEIPATGSPSAGEKPAQTLEEWMSILDGLTDDQLDVFDRLLAARPNLTRNLP